MVVAVAVMMIIPVLATITVEPSTSTIEKTKIGESLSWVSNAPTEPLNVSADPGNGFVWLWWDHPLSQGSDLIKNYTIYRSEQSDGSDPIKIVQTIGPSDYGVNFLNDTSVINDNTYYYQLTADSDAGSSALSGSSWISATPTDIGSAPSGPQNLVVQNLTYSVQLNWSLPSTNGTTPVRFYDIMREENGTTTSLISSDLELWTTGYHDEDSDLLPGHIYNYTVRAINSYGAGPSLQGVHLGGTGPIPGAPENLTADPGNHTVYLSWDLPANPSFYGMTHFNIYRNVTGGSTFVKIDPEE